MRRIRQVLGVGVLVGTVLAAATPVEAGGTHVTGSKAVEGDLVAGGTITYTFTLRNDSLNEQEDNAGDELTDTIPAGLVPVSWQASSGTVDYSAPDLTWNGSIDTDDVITITFVATIEPSAAGTTICNQGTVHYEEGGGGTNDTTRPTDDPDDPAGIADPTCFDVAPAVDPPPPPPPPPPPDVEPDDVAPDGVVAATPTFTG